MQWALGSEKFKIGQKINKLTLYLLTIYFLRACGGVGSISAALSCLICDPPREERLDAWAASRVCDVI